MAPVKFPLIIIIFLLLLTLVGGFVVFMFKSASQSLSSYKPLPPGSFSKQLRLVKETDPKTGKDYLYYVLDVTNNTSDDLYSCKYILTSSGAQVQYHAFSSDYRLRDCQQYSYVKTNYDCRLANALTRWRFYDSSRTWPKLAPRQIQTVTVSRFYTEQTISSQSFLAKNTVGDIYSISPYCKTTSGAKVTEQISF